MAKTLSYDEIKEQQEARNALLVMLYAIETLCDLAPLKPLCVLAPGATEDGGEKRAEEVARRCWDQLRNGLAQFSESKVLIHWQSLDAWKAVVEVVDKAQRITAQPNIPWLTIWERLRPALMSWAQRYDVKQLMAETTANLMRLAGEGDVPPTLASPPTYPPSPAAGEAGRGNDPIQTVQYALISAVCDALCLYHMANSPRERMDTARELYAGHDGDGETDAETGLAIAPDSRTDSECGLAAKWEALSDMDTNDWHDLPYWRFLTQTIAIIAESAPGRRGWGTAWPEIARALRELKPEEDTQVIWADLRERADVLRGTAPWLPDVRPVAVARPEGTADCGRGGTRQGEGTKPKARRGRKPDTDAKEDKRVADAWRTGRYRTYAECAIGLGLTEKEVKEAIDRHRHRPAGKPPKHHNPTE